MQRRQFLRGLGVVVGGLLLEQAIPFNRVWSFPKNLRLANLDEINAISTKYIIPALADDVFKPSPLFHYLTKKGIYELSDTGVRSISEGVDTNHVTINEYYSKRKYLPMEEANAAAPV